MTAARQRTAKGKEGVPHASGPPEQQWPFYINSGDPGDEEGRAKRLAEFERWAAAKKDANLKELIVQTRSLQLQAALEQNCECATRWRQAS